MRTKEELKVLRERVIALRREGKSRREIKDILGLMSNRTLDDALQGVPPPEWTRRPNAKDGVRATARELRAKGLAYHEIAARLGVSKSSVSLWVRDLPGRQGSATKRTDGDPPKVCGGTGQRSAKSAAPSGPARLPTLPPRSGT
jgi:DNA-binding CsgD family transcriptional regulator